MLKDGKVRKVDLGGSTTIEMADAIVADTQKLGLTIEATVAVRVDNSILPPKPFFT